ncbi:uroporphyrinogen-III synthase [Terriglobus roseus DSM 18391]|uniref:Uroporphyrinogen-III synthase n=1 Tax=Terriglobus roseus (strain DSM 18391 / NRRL B-41598 / KBS 63) TaxID=926566 RepID=I3ZE57_TERRK|nr:uroporphyrinogen-III synthase [Terriglobus roseus]AFL87525.1 uroporphyrinogen-III synthase [Terriglobus roseus DSM 18391]
MPHASFDSLRVVSLESRRAREVEKLIRTYNGEPIVVPSMREVPLSSNAACLQFGHDLLADRFDAIIFFTGVGVRAMMRILETEFPRENLLEKLRGLTVISRGVKPQAALIELRVPITALAPEPATWHEVMSVLDTTLGDRAAGMRLAVQEYGASNPEMLSELVNRFDSVTKVPVYQWALPEDLEPLRSVVREIVRGSVDVVLFMTAVQVIHLFQVADEISMQDDLRLALASTVVVSVGPTTTEELQQYGVKPDFEPSRPKMGFMINEAAQYAGKLLAAKRASLPPDDLSAALPPPSATRKTPASGVQQVAAMTATMAGFTDGLAPLDILHEIGSRIALADPLHLVLERIVKFACAVIPCDSCFVYTVEGEQLILRASKNPHADQVDTLNVPVGEGITGWVAKHRESVAIPKAASEDPRFSFFALLPEDRFEAMLSTPLVCANRVIGVINVQHRDPYFHSDLQRRLLATLGILVGAEIERARLETENLDLSQRLESRKVIDRAKGLLQAELGITEEEAYLTMQKESRQRRRSMRDIAEAILLSEKLRQKPTMSESRA